MAKFSSSNIKGQQGRIQSFEKGGANVFCKFKPQFGVWNNFYAIVISGVF